MSLVAPLIIYTVGHSSRSIAGFLALLRSVEIERLVDVRAHPASRRYPQFDAKQLANSLATIGVEYHWAGRGLGGFRKGHVDSLHHAITSAPLRAYADHMETPMFHEAVAQLVLLAQEARTAVMCAEKDPLRCHRSLIADYLTLKGVHVLHLLNTDEHAEHRLSPLARQHGKGLIYDQRGEGELDLDVPVTPKRQR